MPVSEETEEAKALMREAEENIESVAFAHPVVKFIISPHSGSILANTEPHVQLSDAMENKGRDVFSDVQERCGGTGRVPRDKIVDMLLQCGYKHNKDLIASVVDKRCTDSELDERGWLIFLEKYNAPPYYYGQRLRKYAGRGQTQELSELIVRGCDPNTGDGEGLTPLHYACECDRVAIIDALSSLAGSSLKINSQDKYGWTPLHSAAHHGNIDCVEAMLKLGADVTLADNIGKTALHLAVAQGRNGICDMLLTHGAAINAPDKHGMTPLHEAAYKNNERTYQMLCLNKNVDLSLTDTFGNTPEKYFEL